MEEIKENHKRIKEKYPTAMVWFVVGEYIEVFFEDAELTAKILGTVYHPESQQTSFPYSSFNKNLRKIVADFGLRVAVVG